MSSIIQGFTNLIESIFQIIYGTISTAVSAVVNTLHAAFSLVVSLIQGVFNVSEEVIGLVLGNLTLILTVAAAYWGYIIYQQRQGNRNPQPLKELAAKVQQKTS